MYEYSAKVYISFVYELNPLEFHNKMSFLDFTFNKGNVLNLNEIYAPLFNHFFFENSYIYLVNCTTLVEISR